MTEEQKMEQSLNDAFVVCKTFADNPPIKSDKQIKAKASRFIKWYRKHFPLMEPNTTPSNLNNNNHE